MKRASVQASAVLEGDRQSDQQNHPSLSAVLATWLAERKPPSKTALELRATFARFTVSCGSDKPITSVTRGDVRAFRESLLAGDAKRGKGKGALSPASVKKYMNLLGTVFSYAVRTGLLESSPVRGMAFVAGEAAGSERPEAPAVLEGASSFGQVGTGAGRSIPPHLGDGQRTPVRDERHAIRL